MFRLTLLLPLLFICCVSNQTLADDSLPNLPGPADVLLSPQQEFDMGRAWLRSLRSNVPILIDPLVQIYCEHLVWRLLPYSGLEDTKIDLVVIDTTDINAFAVPGGVIGINAGTLLNADSEAEVAAVLSHELAHVSQHHFARRYTDNRNLNRSLLLAMLASLAVAASGHANAGMAGLATTQAAAIQSQLTYSRSQEAEADRIGMQTLVKAGFNPHAMPRFFEKLLQVEQYSGEPPQFLMDHPVTESRIADTEARANTLPSPPYRIDLDFLLTQARLKSLYIHDPEQAEQYFNSLYHGGQNEQQLAAGYGLAMSSMRNQHYKKAHALLTTLEKQSPNTWWFTLGQAEVFMASGDFSKADQVLTTLSQLLPQNYAISVFHARNLLHLNRPDEAQTLLQPLLQQRPEDPTLWQLSARAFGAMKETARAHLARGEYLFLTGQSKQGLAQLQFALKGSRDVFPLHSLIQARLDTMKQAEKQKF